MMSSPSLQPIKIERACLEDGEQILAVQKAAFESQAKLYQCWTLPPLTETLQQWQDGFSSRLVLKAVLNSRIIGTVRAYVEGPLAKVERLSVLPQHQHQGLATQLMTTLEDLLPQAKHLELFTGHKSLSTIKLYEKLGYLPCRNLEGEDGIHLVYMKKTRPDIT